MRGSKHCNTAKKMPTAQSKCAGSRPFGHLQQNICRLLHVSHLSDLFSGQRPLQLRPLLPITIASLPTTQKHFDWAVPNTSNTSKPNENMISDTKTTTLYVNFGALINNAEITVNYECKARYFLILDKINKVSNIQ